MDLLLWIYAILLIALGGYSLLATIINHIHFHHLDKVKDSEKGPLISVIIPARNEENSLGRLLSSIITQTYSNIEILVINDQSTDRTGEIISQFEKKDPRVRGFNTEPGKKLNRNGKINALLQVIPHAKGEYLLCTDADTAHASECIAHTYAIMKKNNLDILSGFPIELCESFLGSISMSAMMLASIFVPHAILYRFPIPSFSVAIGQFIMMNKSSYNDVGGYGNIDNAICDDMGIVKLFVKNRKKYAFLPLPKYVACFMYHERKEAFKGIERSILGVIPAKPLIIAPVAVLVILLFAIALSPVASPVLLFTTGFSAPSILLFAGMLVFYLSWFIACRRNKWRKLVSISGPLTLIATCMMYTHGLYRKLSGKNFVWKGRAI